MSTPASPQGLTSAEVDDRVRRGLVNRVRRSEMAEYLDIVRRNVFTLFNALVVPAAVVLLVLRDFKAGLAVSGMAVTNTLLGLLQEFRAKRQLDRLTLLAESRVRVLRDGTVGEIPAGDIVQGDWLVVAAGDAIVADGPVLQARFLEIDEALLTGESDPVPRKLDDRLLSGSFCVAGEGIYRADAVGTEAFIHKTASEARMYKYAASPLQEQIDRLVRVLTAVAVSMSVSYVVLDLVRGGIELDELVRMIAATITSMVPVGLVLMATLALLLGAVRMGMRGAVVNRLAAVEAMAGVDTLCMDKTGTLTTNRLHFERLHLLADRPEDEVRRLLARFAWSSLDRDSKSLVALRQVMPEQKAELLDQLPFKSQNRYSAVKVRVEGQENALALGAVEVLGKMTGQLPDGWQELAASGLRLLLFAEIEECPRPQFDGSLEGCRLRALALIALGDEVRAEAAGVLEQLAEQGIGFKILSGDNAETVRATVGPLAQNAQSPALRALAHAPVVTGNELESATNSEELIVGRSVFGRVSPWQKVQVVRALTAMGHQVAMIGDGVNDVLPIKNATLGVAMGDGSRASKTVAGVVLRTNDFGLLPELLEEGRLIVRNLRRAGKLFVTKNAYTVVLILGAVWLCGLAFPFAPQQVTLLNLLTIGVPSLLITLDRSRADKSQGDFFSEVGRFSARTGVISGLVTWGLMLISAYAWEDSAGMQRTMVLAALVLLGWVTLWRALGRESSGPLLRWLPVLGQLGFVGAMYVGPMASFFELEALEGVRWLWVCGASAIGAGLMLLDDAWTS